MACDLLECMHYITFNQSTTTISVGVVGYSNRSNPERHSKYVKFTSKRSQGIYILEINEVIRMRVFSI